MADNSTLPVSVGTEVFANKDMSGVKYPKQIPSDGTNLATIKPASTPAASTDTGMVVHIHPLSLNANVGNNTDAIASGATAGAPVVDFLYGYNGTTWDRLQVDGSKNLKVNIASPLGSAATAASLPAALATDQTTIAVTQDTSKIGSGTAGTFLTPATVKINIAGATTTTVVALVAAKKIRILACYLVLGGANNVNWQSHTTTSNGDAALTFASGSGLVLNYNPIGWFDTTAGEALDIVTSTSAQLSGRIVYVVV